MGYNPWGRKELDRTEQLMHFQLHYQDFTSEEIESEELRDQLEFLARVRSEAGVPPQVQLTLRHTPSKCRRTLAETPGVYQYSTDLPEEKAPAHSLCFQRAGLVPSWNL